MKQLTLKDRMNGRPVQVTTEDILGAFCDTDRDGQIESLKAQVESLIRVVAILVDNSPEALERLIELQWRFER